MSAQKILMPTAEAVVAVNKRLCERDGNPHHCNEIGKVESAINTAFYPGQYPFAHGGIAKIAGALCFYLVQCHAFVDGNKRTGMTVAIAFLRLHGMNLRYPLDPKNGVNALADIIEKCAASQVTKEKLMDWFEAHRVYM